jgi:hypothetical protein
METLDLLMPKWVEQGGPEGLSENSLRLPGLDFRMCV